ncbi:zinc finger protein [Mactra antiquata]
MTAKSQSFSISAILMKDSVKDCKKKQVENDESATISKRSSETLNETPYIHNKYDVKETPKRTKTEGTTKRKRDPIGQILDSLCNETEKKSMSSPSAFTPPVVTSSSQLSPLSMLAQADRRCYQTSPNGVHCAQFNPTSHEAMSQVRTSMDQYQYIQAQRLAYAQRLHHHHQQQQQQRLVTMNAGTQQPYLAQQHNQYQLQMLREHQAKMMSLELANTQTVTKNTHFPTSCHPQNPTVPYLMAWLKSSAEPMTSYPVKESRIPPPPRYQCDSCKKSYSTFGGLSKHKQFHCVSHVKKEFTCKYCEKSYGSLGALKMHIRTHTLPCKCKLCGKAFSRPWLLQGHVRTHTGEKPFKCVHCGRAFADRSNLRAHLQTHSDIKKYGCKNCTKTFSRMSLLLKHEEGSCVGLRR